MFTHLSTYDIATPRKKNVNPTARFSQMVAPHRCHRAPAQLFQHLVVVVCVHKGLSGFLGVTMRHTLEFDELSNLVTFVTFYGFYWPFRAIIINIRRLKDIEQ